MIIPKNKQGTSDINTIDSVSDSKINLEEEIKKLKKQLNAVILAHYYQYSEIQNISDYIGDSLQLAQEAAKTNADVIVFAGVHFMAETAKILNPDKLVLLPDLEAGCSLAEGCPASLFKKFREKYPDHIIISYINCSAEVKAMSDIIVTSSNAEKIVNKIPPEQKIIFAPDRNLGKYIIKKTGRDMVLWQGSCIVHETFSIKKILRLKTENPDAKIISHPECEEPVLDISDFIGSTSALLNFVQSDSAAKYIVVTEPGILNQMQKRNPGKIYISAPPETNCSCNECPYMKLNTMEKLYLCMKNKKPEIILDESIREKALKPILKMLEMS